MAMDGEGSVTRWINELKAGDADAARPLWDRYFHALVRLARARIQATSRPGADEDEEDAALSAFGSFCEGAADGRFPQAIDREALWPLLVVITSRKAWAQVHRRARQKRGGLSKLENHESRLDGIAGTEPTPEFAAMIAEEFRRLIDQLEDDGLRQVALWRMDGYTVDEIAAKLGCARRTVARRLDLIRKTWELPRVSADRC